MPNYLLPCSCGRAVPVSVSMAGESVRCECGTELEVPTLRGLRQLTPEPASAGRRARSWNDRQRVTFVFVVAGLAAAALAGYQAYSLPALPEQGRVEGPLPIDQTTSPVDVYSKFNHLEKGIQPGVKVISPQGKQSLERRALMIWGIRIALTLSACSMVAAAVTLLASRRQNR
jgi:hypothetical protein